MEDHRVNREYYSEVEDQDVDEVMKLQDEFRESKGFSKLERRKEIMKRLEELNVNTIVNFGCYPYIK